MAGAFTPTLKQIVALCQEKLQAVTIVQMKENPQIGFIELQAEYHGYRIQLKEILRANGSRKYAYYVLKENQVIAGFDNAADPEALRLKYDKNYSQHRLEEIPHYHSTDKATIELTPAMSCEMFIVWLEQHLPQNMA